MLIDSLVLIEAGAYTIMLMIFLVTVYALPYLNLNKIIDRNAWIVPKVPISQAMEHGPGTQRTSPETLTAGYPTVRKVGYGRNWWIDEKTFQLERRAIFSKVWCFNPQTTLH